MFVYCTYFAGHRKEKIYSHDTTTTTMITFSLHNLYGIMHTHYQWFCLVSQSTTETIYICRSSYPLVGTERNGRRPRYHFTKHLHQIAGAIWHRPTDAYWLRFTLDLCAFIVRRNVYSYPSTLHI